MQGRWITLGIELILYLIKMRQVVQKLDWSVTPFLVFLYAEIFEKEYSMM